MSVTPDEKLSDFTQHPYLTLKPGFTESPWTDDELNRLDYLFTQNKNKTHAPKGLIGWMFDVGKKFADTVDDCWNAMRGFLPASLGGLSAILISSIGGTIHLVEVWDNIKLLAKAHREKKLAQRKTKMGTSLVSSLLGLTGVGFSLALFLDGINVGVPIIGAFAMPAIIPGLLLLIYGIKVGRYSYGLHIAKQNEKKAQAVFSEIVEQQAHENSQAVQAAQDRYLFFREQRIKAERKVAFGMLEMLGSVGIVTGVILGTAGIVGASAVASFGILPLAIILVGAGIAASAKIFEYVDGKRDHALSRKIKSWFSPDHAFTPTLKNQASIHENINKENTTQIITSTLNANPSPLQQKKAVPLESTLSLSQPIIPRSLDDLKEQEWLRFYHAQNDQKQLAQQDNISADLQEERQAMTVAA